MHCLSPEKDADGGKVDVERYDVGFLGAGLIRYAIFFFFLGVRVEGLAYSKRRDGSGFGSDWMLGGFCVG